METMTSGTVISRSEHETCALAASLVGELERGTIFALTGELGSGKTLFVQAAATALGVQGTVTSPTFVIMNVYPIAFGNITTLVHVDCYRLHDTEELRAIGLEDYLNDPSAVVFIEWADKAVSLIPAGALWIDFTVTDLSTRTISVSDDSAPHRPGRAPDSR